MESALEHEQILRRALQSPTSNAGWTAIGIVVCAHLLAIWGLFQIEAVRVAVRDVAPTLVEFVVAEEPLRPEPVPHPRPAVPTRVPTPVQPVIATAATPQAPVATWTVPPSEPAPVAVEAPPSAVVAPTPAPPAPPPASPRVLPASAVQYLVQPPIEVPALSRRLGEQGTVWLRVRVGRDGLPQQIGLQKSSGYERLDRQAQDAMRAARFKPQTENGQAIEWVVTAPLQYDIE